MPATLHCRKYGKETGISASVNGFCVHSLRSTAATNASEHKQAEEREKRVAEEWQTTFDSITDMVSIQDKDCRLVRVNKAYANAMRMSSGSDFLRRIKRLIYAVTQ